MTRQTAIGLALDGMRMALAAACLTATVLVPALADENSSKGPGAEAMEALQGGATTTIAPLDVHVFEHPNANLAEDNRMDFLTGRALFRKLWVPAPASTKGSDGLGPYFNARSCEACHINDGRGIPFWQDGAQGRGQTGLVLKLRAADGVGPDPDLGRQWQDKAVTGMLAEATVALSFRQHDVRLGDGTVIELRQPIFALTPDRPGRIVSPRLAPPVIGLGLLEAIADSDIKAAADPEDKNADGISGRLSIVKGEDGKPGIGRFGWRAETATVRQQSAAAFSIDMGLSTALFPDPAGDCTPSQTECLKHPNGIGPSPYEVHEHPLAAIAFYARHIGVPARRKAHSSEVLAGKALFYQTGCAACHQPMQKSRSDIADKSLASQTFWPYSDLLLHDMGDGLADIGAKDQVEFREWRTPPLWGIGLAGIVSGGHYYLHDGRARSLVEAILWHGGEARNAAETFAVLPSADRARLIAFLESL